MDTTDSRSRAEVLLELIANQLEVLVAAATYTPEMNAKEYADVIHAIAQQRRHLGLPLLSGDYIKE